MRAIIGEQWITTEGRLDLDNLDVAVRRAREQIVLLLIASEASVGKEAAVLAAEHPRICREQPLEVGLLASVVVNKAFKLCDGVPINDEIEREGCLSNRGLMTGVAWERRTVADLEAALATEGEGS